MEYYEALIPSVISALTAFVIFRTFIGYGGALYHLSQLSNLSMVTLFKGALMGLVGAAIAILFPADFITPRYFGRNTRLWI